MNYTPFKIISSKAPFLDPSKHETRPAEVSTSGHGEEEDKYDKKM